MYYDIKESGLRIKELRRKSGMTQEELAEKVCVSLETVSKIERGIRGASIEVLDDIARCFGVDMEYLAFGRKRTVDFCGIQVPEDKIEMVLKVLRAIVE